MKAFFTLLLVLIMPVVKAGVLNSNDLAAAYSYLNQIRQQAGMSTFTKNVRLEAAALNHANYLADNILTGHYQYIKSAKKFTGLTPQDRTSFTGYRSLLVSENVSSGNTNSIRSIDGLMSAIYHRFAFLDFAKTEIGIGIAKNLKAQHSAYVYKMGNAAFNRLCKTISFSNEGRYYSNICNSNIHINAGDFDREKLLALSANNKIVMWPTNDDKHVPPAFFHESPDPLPDIDVSGFPISLQFNPLNFSSVKIKSFKLYTDSNNIEIVNTRLLSKQTDPNGRLNSLQYALFPLERLDWNTWYRVEVQYIHQGKIKNLQWRFRTKNLNLPLFKLDGDSNIVRIPPNTSAIAVYIPPTESHSKIGKLSYSYDSNMKVAVKYEDSNTLLIIVTGKVGQEASFNFSGKRSFRIKIRENVTKICEPAILSANMNLYIPNIRYKPIPTKKSIKIWADLHLIDKKDMIFKLHKFGSPTINLCKSANLYSDLIIHIPHVYYLSANTQKPQIISLDLKHLGQLKFQVLNKEVFVIF
jgi:hypothetical protein